MNEMGANFKGEKQIWKRRQVQVPLSFVLGN